MVFSLRAHEARPRYCAGGMARLLLKHPGYALRLLMHPRVPVVLSTLRQRCFLLEAERTYPASRNRPNRKQETLQTPVTTHNPTTSSVIPSKIPDDSRRPNAHHLLLDFGMWTHSSLCACCL